MTAIFPWKHLPSWLPWHHTLLILLLLNWLILTKMFCIFLLNSQSLIFIFGVLPVWYSTLAFSFYAHSLDDHPLPVFFFLILSKFKAQWNVCLLPRFCPKFLTTCSSSLFECSSQTSHVQMWRNYPN